MSVETHFFNWKQLAMKRLFKLIIVSSLASIVLLEQYKDLYCEKQNYGKACSFKEEENGNIKQRLDDVVIDLRGGNILNFKNITLENLNSDYLPAILEKSTHPSLGSLKSRPIEVNIKYCGILNLNESSFPTGTKIKSFNAIYSVYRSEVGKNKWSDATLSYKL